MWHIMPDLYTVHSLSVSHRTAYLKFFSIVVTNKVLCLRELCGEEQLLLQGTVVTITMFYCCGETSAHVVIYLLVLSKYAVG
jgi:hypothetical protein